MIRLKDLSSRYRINPVLKTTMVGAGGRGLAILHTGIKTINSGYNTETLPVNLCNVKMIYQMFTNIVFLRVVCVLAY